MGNTRPKFSVLIPTRNGCRYLRYAVESVITQKEQNFELIISNNHSTDDTAEYLSSLVDPRVKVISPPSMLSIASHFDFIVEHSTGEWVTILGDDDGLMPFFFEKASILIQRSPTYPIVCRRALYFWPGCEDVYGDIVASYNCRTSLRDHSSRWNLFLAICSIKDFIEMPQLYTTGIIPASVIRIIRKKSQNRFFQTRSHDGYSSAAIALASRRYYRSEEPLFWTGSSPKSIGLSVTKGANDIISEFEKTNLNDENVHFTKDIPIDILMINEFATYVYEGVLSCPFAGPFWKSTVVKYFFYAGISILKEENESRVLKSCGETLNQRLFGICKFLVAALRKHYVNLSRAEKSELSFYSNQRSQCPDLISASNIIGNLHSSNK